MKKKSRGFSLIEVTVVILLMGILSAISFSVVNPNNSALLFQNTRIAFVNNLRRSQELSFRGLSFGGDKVCATGIVFSEAVSYTGIFKTVSIGGSGENVDCVKIMQDTPELFNMTISGSESGTISKNLILQTGTDNALSQTWDTVQLEKIEYTDVGGNKTELGMTGGERLSVVFVSPFADPIVFYSADTNPLENWSNITFSLKVTRYGFASTVTDTATVILTKAGQILSR
ncbi:MAG: hypothetical protein UU76_C0016G0014 [Parcubacteria group bacterium GW2011_GWC1_41_7]|nr:MAG: hypothetical protein UU76_C0016G0014 [Parcubacteria group bacterium GW2011_GWC1_41_7]